MTAIQEIVAIMTGDHTLAPLKPPPQQRPQPPQLLIHAHALMCLSRISTTDSPPPFSNTNRSRLWPPVRILSHTPSHRQFMMPTKTQACKPHTTVSYLSESMDHVMPLSWKNSQIQVLTGGSLT